MDCEGVNRSWPSLILRHGSPQSWRIVSVVVDACVGKASIGWLKRAISSTKRETKFGSPPPTEESCTAFAIYYAWPILDQGDRSQRDGNFASLFMVAKRSSASLT